MKTVYILLGASGAGKSYLANDLVQQLYERDGSSAIVSADYYFTPEIWADNKVYEWNVNYLNDAHLMCARQFDMCIQGGVQGIIVDNTNLKYSSIAAYAERAIIEGYMVEIIEPQTAWRYDAEECYRHSQHKVPLKTIKNMLACLSQLKISYHEMIKNPTKYFKNKLFEVNVVELYQDL